MGNPTLPPLLIDCEAHLSSPFWVGVKGDIEESQDFHHVSEVMESPHYSICEGPMGNLDSHPHVAIIAR